MKKGFTLIELLIVIAIIGILTTITLSSYSSTRQVAEINMQTDLLVSALREAKGKSQNTTTPNCIGFKFTNTNSQENADSIIPVAIPYNNQFKPCDISTPDNSTPETNNSVTNNSLTDITLQVTKINFINGNAKTDINSFYFLYYPPKGEFLVYKNSDTTPATFTEIEIETKLKNKDNNNIVKIQNSGLIQKARKSEPVNN